MAAGARDRRFACQPDQYACQLFLHPADGRRSRQKNLFSLIFNHITGPIDPRRSEWRFQGLESCQNPPPERQLFLQIFRLQNRSRIFEH